MRSMRFSPGFLIALAACAGPSVLPEEYAKRLPAARELDPAARARAEAQAQEGLAAALAGRHSAARPLAEAALAADPRQAAARAALALCLMQEARAEDPPTLSLWRRAEGELLIADQLAPSDPEVQRARAAFLVADGHLSAAAECLDAALKSSPSHVELLREASRLHYELGEERAAGSLLVRLLAHVPEEPDATYRLAQVRTRLAASLPADDQPARKAAFLEAAAAFHRYGELVPEDANAMLGEAYARFKAAETEGSVALVSEGVAILELYEQAGRLLTRSPEPWYGKAIVLEALGRVDEAKQSYRDAVERDTTHVGAVLNLIALLASGPGAEKDEAKELAKRSLGLELTASERRRLAKFVTGE